MSVKGKKNRFNYREANRMPKSLARSGVIFCYLMLALSIVHFAIFWFGVNIQSFFIAFTVRDGTGIERFSLSNFELFFNEIVNPLSAVRNTVLNTVWYFLIDMLKRILGFFTAYFFFKKVWGYKTFRVIFFLPSIISDVIEVTVFKNFISTYGPLYQFVLSVFGVEMPVLLGNATTATPTILFYVVWSGFGSTMLIFVGVMNRIPEEILEAAKIDGSTWSTEFIKIVIPLTWETLYTMLVLGLSGIFMASGPIMVFTGGAFNTYTLSYWLFSQVQNGTYNYPAAISLIFSTLTIPIVFISRWILSKFSPDVQY